jgi:hypothetical protein
MRCTLTAPLWAAAVSRGMLCSRAAVPVFKLLEKYRPETHAQKVERLKAAAETKAAGAAGDDAKRCVRSLPCAHQPAHVPLHAPLCVTVCVPHSCVSVHTAVCGAPDRGPRVGLR